MTHRDPIPFEGMLKEVEGLRALARGLLRDEHDVDDVLQETRLRAWHRVPSSPLRPWLARVARNLALNRLRGTRRRLSHERAALRAPAPSGPDEIASRMETQQRLAQAVAELAEPYRTTIFLRFFEDLTPSDIATRLREPGGTVRSRLKRGLDLLRARLDREHGDDRRACGVALAALAGMATEGSAASLLSVGARTFVALGVAAAVLLGVLVVLYPGSDDAAGRIGGVQPVAGLPAELDLPAPLAAVAATDRATRVLQGRVEAAWGAPIPGATVIVAAAPPGGLRLRETVPVATAMTTGDGGFRFEVEKGEYRVAAHAVGFAWAEVEPATRTHGIVLRLFPSRRLPGVVVDESGAPVAGARVLAFGFPGDEMWTGADGSFEVEAGPEGASFRVEHPRFVPTWASERYPPARVVLGAPQTLSGVVLDAEGKPVAGAEVTVWGRNAHDVRTDAGGRFRVDGFAAGRAGETDEEGPPRFWMRVDARERGWRFLDKLVWTPGHELRIALPRTRVLHARVTEAGRPVAGLGIVLTSNDASETSFVRERPVAEAVTDPEGRFTFHVSSPGWAIVLKLRGDYAFAPPANGYLPRDADDVDVPVVRAPWAKGRVLGPDGAPIVGASVWLEEPTRREPRPPRWASSAGDDGRFRLLVPFWPTGVVVRAAHDGHEISTSEPFMPEAGREYEFELRLVAFDARRDITGVVVTEDGSPAAMAHIVAQSQEPRDSGETYVAPEGTFRIRGLKEGVYQVSASWPFARGVTTEATTGVPVRITIVWPLPPKPPDLPAQAPPTVAMSVITGRVLDAEGKPFPYDSVPEILWQRAEGRPGRGFMSWGKVRCDLDGRFDIRVAEEGTYKLQVQGVWPPVFRPVEGVRAGTRDLVLRPEKTGAITGRVRLRDGSGPRWLRVYAVSREKVGPDGRPRTSGGNWEGEGATDIDKEGRFRIEGLLGDRYVIVAHDEKHAVAFRPAVVGDDVEIVVEPGLPLAGRVVSKDGKPPSKVLVRVEDALGVNRQSWVEPDGTFAFTGLPDGPCRVHALAEVHLLAILEAVQPGTKDLVLTLEQYDAEEFQRRTTGSRKDAK